MVALHRVYLEPEGPIYNALIQAIVNPVELKSALNPSSKSYNQAIFVIADALKNIIARIVDFMVDIYFYKENRTISWEFSSSQEMVSLEHRKRRR